jgi:hypothetical protein
MPPTLDVVAAGHLCLDIFPDLSESSPADFRQSLRPGHLLEVGPATFCTGGSVSNTGIALHKLGMRTRLLGKIGDDAVGLIIQDFIRHIDPTLGENLIIAAGTTSSYTIVLASPTLDRIFLHYPGPNDTFRAADIPYEVVRRSRLFHFGYPPLMKAMVADAGAELAQMFARVQALGVTIPALLGQFIVLVKDSSLVSLISVLELTRAGQLMASERFMPAEGFFTVAAFYLLIYYVLKYLSNWWQNRLIYMEGH